jgi:prefoldin subunit 5
MDPQTIETVIARVEAIESEIAALRQAIDRHELAVSDRQYLSRCFELLTMELEALRSYLRGVAHA